MDGTADKLGGSETAARPPSLISDVVGGPFMLISEYCCPLGSMFSLPQSILAHSITRPRGKSVFSSRLIQKLFSQKSGLLGVLLSSSKTAIV